MRILFQVFTFGSRDADVTTLIGSGAIRISCNGVDVTPFAGPVLLKAGG